MTPRTLTSPGGPRHGVCHLKEEVEALKVVIVDIWTVDLLLLTEARCILN